MVLVIWPSITLKFQFVYSFNQCLRAIFSLNLGNFWFYIWVVVAWLLISEQRWLYVTSYLCPWIKNLSAKTAKYIPKCWENVYMVKTFLKILWWRFLVTHSERLFVSNATSLCKTKNILTLSMLVYFNTNSFLLRSFSLMHCLVCPVHYSRY